MTDQSVLIYLVRREISFSLIHCHWNEILNLIIREMSRGELRAIMAVISFQQARKRRAVGARYIESHRYRRRKLNGRMRR